MLGHHLCICEWFWQADGILQGRHCHQCMNVCGNGFMLYCSVKALWVVRLTSKMLHKCSPFTIPYLFEVHYNATFLHHGVFLIVIHQVSQGVKPLTTSNIIFTVLLKIWNWQFNTAAATTWGVIKSPEIQCRGHSLRHSSRLFSFAEFNISVYVMLILCLFQTWSKSTYLVAYHYVGDLGLSVYILVFLLISENWEDKVARFTLALPHQEATGFAFICEQFLCISAGQVPMVPPGQEVQSLRLLAQWAIIHFSICMFLDIRWMQHYVHSF